MDKRAAVECADDGNAAAGRVAHVWVAAPDLAWKFGRSRIPREGRTAGGVGIPGYVAPMDQDMKLFLRYAGGVSGVDVFPAGAMTVAAGANTRNGWKHGCCARGAVRASP